MAGTRDRDAEDVAEEFRHLPFLPGEQSEHPLSFLAHEHPLQRALRPLHLQHGIRCYYCVIII